MAKGESALERYIRKLVAAVISGDEDKIDLYTGRIAAVLMAAAPVAVIAVGLGLFYPSILQTIYHEAIGAVASVPNISFVASTNALAFG